MEASLPWDEANEQGFKQKLKNQKQVEQQNLFREKQVDSLQ